MKGLSFNDLMIKAWIEGRKTVTRRLMKPQPCNDPWIEVMEPPYHNGETVYIREAWGMSPIISEGVVYRGNYPVPNVVAWKSSRSMPAWAARSHALIVSVKPERVQDITEEETRREGVLKQGYIKRLDRSGTAYYSGFADLWESIYPGSWERNDWVWRFELEKEGNK